MTMKIGCFWGSNSQDLHTSYLHTRRPLLAAKDKDKVLKLDTTPESNTFGAIFQSAGNLLFQVCDFGGCPGTQARLVLIFTCPLCVPPPPSKTAVLTQPLIWTPGARGVGTQCPSLQSVPPSESTQADIVLATPDQKEPHDPPICLASFHTTHPLALIDIREKNNSRAWRPRSLAGLIPTSRIRGSIRSWEWIRFMPGILRPEPAPWRLQKTATSMSHTRLHTLAHSMRNKVTVVVHSYTKRPKNGH